jgi:hypothetical protein
VVSGRELDQRRDQQRLVLHQSEHGKVSWNPETIVMAGGRALAGALGARAHCLGGGRTSAGRSVTPARRVRQAASG